MTDKNGARGRRPPISSRVFFVLTIIVMVFGIAGYLLSYPILLGVSIVVALFLVVGGVYRLANERHWLD